MLNFIQNPISNLISNLSQFVNHKVEITTRDSRITFIYQDFNYDICDNDLVLMDEIETDCRVYIPLNEITDVTNLTNDLYSTVVDVKHGDELENKMISICCAEHKPIPVTCSKCGYVFGIEEQVWRIEQQGQYGSAYDGDWICKKLCDKCVSTLIESD